MSEQALYLKPNVVIEPLYDRWYAWSHLISPATAAMNVAGRHLKIMNSYIQAPQIHAAAVKNVKMKGGPFMDYNGGRVEEVRQLRDKTLVKQKHVIEFAEAIRSLDKLLKTTAKGDSLEPLYEKVPDVLKGYVELVYDLNNNASFRVVEPLLYRSRYYDASRQGLMLSLIHEDERPFVLSTPRLRDPDEVEIKISFRNRAIDELFRMKRTPRSFGEIREQLNISAEDVALAQSFFTEEVPAPYQPYSGTGVRWRYFGHACILVETNGVNVLFDPVLSYTYENRIKRYTYDDLPDQIDYVVITHNHQDHILFETMIQLRHKVKTIIVPRNGGGALQDPSLKLMFHNVGFH